MKDALTQRVAEARARLDAHTREIVAWHFDPATGCPFWLELARSLGWDPRREVQRYADLDKFPPFEDEWLRGGPVRRWVPRGLAGRPVYVFETGGSTGVPKSRINVEDFRVDYELFSQTLDDAYFPKGSDWLMLGPTGPRRLRLAVEHLAQHRGGICFCVDLDPRWVVKLTREGRLREMHEYKDHVINQALTILRAHENIRCLFATPKLLEALCERISLVQAGITGVFCGGTSMTAQFYRFACEELLEGGPEWWKPPEAGSRGQGPKGPRGPADAPSDPRPVGLPATSSSSTPWPPGPPDLPRKKIDFVPTYGNTLMGLAYHKPFDPADNYMVIYHAPLPRAMIEVVDPNDPTRVVDYGQVGRVRLTTLTKEFFMPRFLERDEGVRTPPCEKYPWDGVGDVRPFSGFATPIVEGVY